MTDRPTDAPAPEAIAVANECATEDGPGGPHLAMPSHQIRRVALALDAFAKAAVEKERERAAQAAKNYREENAGYGHTIPQI